MKPLLLLLAMSLPLVGQTDERFVIVEAADGIDIANYENDKQKMSINVCGRGWSDYIMDSAAACFKAQSDPYTLPVCNQYQPTPKGGDVLRVKDGCLEPATGWRPTSSAGALNAADIEALSIRVATLEGANAGLEVKLEVLLMAFEELSKKVDALVAEEER